MNSDEGDSYQGFKKDPRLTPVAQDLAEELPATKLTPLLKKRLHGVVDKQDFYDVLRLFKREQIQKTMELETSPFKNRELILKKNAVLAQTILIAAYEFVRAEMETSLGIPTGTTSYGQTIKSHLAIVGMGKLGTGEMDYESDLDLIFIFSEPGEVLGKKRVSNLEYFAKFAQRLIHLLSVMTGAGKCYSIDVELRPSGHAGLLVSSCNHFLDHQMNRAEEWERMALLRAWPVVAPKHLEHTLKNHLTTLAFAQPVPQHFFSVMHKIRQRVLKERVKEPDNSFDLKLGLGGLMDVDFVLLGTELKYQKLYPELRQRSVFALIEALKNTSILSATDRQVLSDAHILYRSVVAQIQLLEKRPLTQLSFESELYSKVSERLGYTGNDILRDRLVDSRQKVKELYEHIYQNS